MNAHAADPFDAIRARLSGLLQSEGLRPKVARVGAELLELLDTPVRLVLFGLPGAGKTSVLNSLAGRILLPEYAWLPTTILRHADRQMAHATLPDGSRESREGTDLDAILALSPALIELELPEPVLRGFTLMEVVADADPADQRAAMAWAAPRTDIAIWVSESFGRAEAEIWEAAPDALRNNGYLVLTGGAPPRAATDGFVASLPLDDPSQIARMRAVLLQAAERGRRAALDHALLFLSLYAPETAPAQVTPQEPQRGPAATSTAPAPVAATSPAPGDDETAAQPEICGSAAALLRASARDLSLALPTFGRLTAPKVFDHCLKTVEDLARRVTGSGPAEDMVLDAADAIVLLQGEGGAAQAADAVTLLLQLRRDLEARTETRMAA